MCNKTVESKISEKKPDDHKGEKVQINYVSIPFLFCTQKDLASFRK